MAEQQFYFRSECEQQSSCPGISARGQARSAPWSLTTIHEVDCFTAQHGFVARTAASHHGP